MKTNKNIFTNFGPTLIFFEKKIRIHIHCVWKIKYFTPEYKLFQLWFQPLLQYYQTSRYNMQIVARGVYKSFVRFIFILALYK